MLTICFQKGSKESTAAMRLIPHFRLLATCVHSENDGDLVSIDALIGYDMTSKFQLIMLIEIILAF